MSLPGAPADQRRAPVPKALRPPTSVLPQARARMNSASLSEPCASATGSSRWDPLSFPHGPHSILATPHSGGPRRPRAFSTWTPSPGHTCLPPAADPGGPATCWRAHHAALPSVGLAQESNPALLLLPRALGGRKPCIPRPPTWAPQARPARPEPEDPSALPQRAPCPPASQQRLRQRSCLSTTGPSWTPRESSRPELRHLASLSWPQRYSAAPAALGGLHVLCTTRVRRARAPADTHPTTHTPPPTLTPLHRTPRAHTRPRLRSPAPRDRAHTARAGKPSANGPLGWAESSCPRERRRSAAPAPDDRPRWVVLGLWPGFLRLLASAGDPGRAASGGGPGPGRKRRRSLVRLRAPVPRSARLRRGRRSQAL